MTSPVRTKRRTPPRSPSPPSIRRPCCGRTTGTRPTQGWWPTCAWPPGRWPPEPVPDLTPSTWHHGQTGRIRAHHGEVGGRQSARGPSPLGGGLVGPGQGNDREERGRAHAALL